MADLIHGEAELDDDEENDESFDEENGDAPKKQKPTLDDSSEEEEDDDDEEAARAVCGLLLPKGALVTNSPYLRFAKASLSMMKTMK